MPQHRIRCSRQQQILTYSCALAILLNIVCFSLRAGAQVAETGSQASVTAAILPNLVRFNGRAADASGKPPSGLVGITFGLYEQETGGPALWLETQNVQLDANGRYSVLLGASSLDGLPNDVFSSGQARWVGVQVSGQAERPRVMLLTVPYAMKAGDAATLGGLPPSAFMAAGRLAAGAPSGTNLSSAMPTATIPVPSLTASNVTTTGGTVNAIPLFTTASNVQNSILTQTAASAINLAGKLNLPANGVATATGGKNSRPEDFVASAFNSSSAAAIAQTFQLQAEAASNNTAAPFGTLNLLYGSGTTAPAETGFKINNKGIITFAIGQTFPGTGKGTITGVVPGNGLSGGGTSGTVTLSLDTTKVPELTANNSFSGTEQFKAAVGIGTTPMANGYTPLSIGTANAFGTWFALANSSTGGHTWNIISAGSGNAEGAGNLGITDLTGKSTIWLEGNTKTTSLTATAGLNAATLVATATAGSAIIDADGFGQNAGGPTPGLRFGGGGSGEGIASNRVIGLTKYGLDFYTNYTARMSVLQNGQVAIGTASPGAQLGVVGSSNAYPGIYAQGGAAASGSGQNGSDGIDAYGNSGDQTSGSTTGGAGISGFGGSGTQFGGPGGIFTGGSITNCVFCSGDGIEVFAGGPTEQFGPKAAFFDGDIEVNGSVYNDAASIIIDHPLDPANKYLSHSSVESPDMMNIYNGNVVTDADGDAVVPLPEWFETLNRDFRYQLTTIGQPAQAWIASKIANHSFTIKTDKPNVEISWQVTGIRQDAWANAHRLAVEAPKLGREAGHYLHPELYAAPEEASIEWARQPKLMKRLQELRKKSLPIQPNRGTR
jgi:trimeric autotransporter adhesin